MVNDANTLEQCPEKGQQTFLRKHLFSKRSLFFLFFTAFFLNIILSSCDDDGYSLNDLYADYGVVNKNDDSFTITTDHGDVLFPSAPYIPEGFLKNNERIIVYFTVLGDADSTSNIDYYVKINDIYQILTKDIIPYKIEISDSLGTDPLIINDVWINNGYITFDFFYTGGQMGLKHMISLAKHTDLTDDDGRLLFELRHNAFNDPYRYKYRGLVAFPADQIAENIQDSVQLRIKYNGFEKEEAEDLTWYIKENNLSNEPRKSDLPKPSKEALFH